MKKKAFLNCLSHVVKRILLNIPVSGKPSSLSVVANTRRNLSPRSIGYTQLFMSKMRSILNDSDSQCNLKKEMNMMCFSYVLCIEIGLYKLKLAYFKLYFWLYLDTLSNFFPSGSMSFTSKISSNNTPAILIFFCRCFQ